MKLTREQRSELFAGRAPRILYPGKVACPIVAGHVHFLSSKVSIQVLDVRRTKKGDWRLDYLIRDDRPNLIRRVPPIHDPRREAKRGVPTEAELDRAARESAVTHSTSEAVPGDPGEVVDEFSQRRFTKEAHEHGDHQQLVNEARREQYELHKRLERVREAARRLRIDISKDERVIEKRIQALERKVLDRAA